MRTKYLKKERLIFRLNNIQLIAYDFDGVLTDNRVILGEDGLESVVLNRSDGLAINIIKNLGIKQIIVTTESNKVVEMRAIKLGIPIIKGTNKKKEGIISFCNENNIRLDKVIYIGNDINDLEIMKVVGYPICPSDAYKEVRKISKIILKSRGGDGVVRELLEYIKININDN
jgi:3-deoxy-D-manno-octulosonate 8-phosphate phosphatase (KDO 8-P phosphatase)